MNKLKLALIAAALGLAGPSFSQDLINKVPVESNMVLAINGKSFFKHVDAAQVNAIFARLGFFKNVMGNNNPIHTNDIQDMGIDIKAKAYIHSITTDSVQFIGGLFPLSDRSKFESLLPKNKKIEQVNGLSTIYSADRTIRLSWDNHTIYAMGGVAMYNYFNRDDIKQRYGFLEQEEAALYDEPMLADSVAVEFEAWDPENEAVEAASEAAAAAAEAAEAVEEAEAAVAEAAQEVKEAAATEVVLKGKKSNEKEAEKAAVAAEDIPPPMITGTLEESEIAEVDSVLAQEEYQDDYYLEYRRIENHNDSIKNAVVAVWLDAKLNDVIAGKGKRITSKKLRNIKDNELIRFEIDRIDELYGYFYPADILYSTLGMRPAFNYGYQSASGAAVIEGNKLRVVGDLTFDKTMTKYYRDMYKHKLNPDFYKYLDKNALGFMTLNINTEAYIKHMPNIVTRVFGENQENRYAEIIDVFATSFDILLDEAAIAKVFKGDNLIVLNGVTKKEVTYTDYEYDEDYNYTEVERTKTENIPDFLWMFSSDDVRIFEKLIKIGIREEGLVDHGGIYELKTGSREVIKPFLLIHKGIVFLGNDLEKLKAIKENSYRGVGDKSYVNLAKKNPMVALFNTPKLPSMLSQLDIPVHRSMQKTVDELSKYGNIYMVGSPMKGNSMQGELAIEFPQGEKNALSFLVNLIDNWTLQLED